MGKSKILIFVMMGLSTLVPWGCDEKVVNSERRPQFHELTVVQVRSQSSSSQITPCHRQFVVAIVDTGIDLENSRLRSWLWSSREKDLSHSGDRNPSSSESQGKGFAEIFHGWNFIENSPNIQDDHGHGTHVAGLIVQQLEEAGLTPNSCPRISLMPLKYFGLVNRNRDTLKTSLAAFRFALEKKVNLINFSGGGREFSMEEAQVFQALEKENTLVVAAAGNDGIHSNRDRFFPAGYPFDNILAVGALSQKGTWWEQSNGGNQWVHVATRGQKLNSDLPGLKKGLLSGTSQATAWVTGAVLTLWSQSNSLLSPHQTISHFVETGDFHRDFLDKTLQGTSLNLNRALNSKNLSMEAFGDSVAEGPEDKELFLDESWLTSRINAPDSDPLLGDQTPQ